MVQLRGYSFVVTENLFSKHYLEHRVTEHGRWKDKEEYEEIFEEIKSIYQEEKDALERHNEDSLRDQFISKILKLLKHKTESNVRADQAQLFPDYAFFKDDGERREALQRRERGEEYYTSAIAVGEAKEWNTPLDKKRGTGPVHARDNPSYQINRYLRITQKRWGILTNGKLWRLYFVDTSETLESYYEIDLQEIIEKDDISGFRYFHVFFERDSFIEDATGKNFLDAVYEQGLTYAKEVGEDLQKNIYEALRTLCQGYLDFTANSFERDKETINTIHYNSLIYLYRILFVLYADARGMLRTKKTGYGDYDIDNVKDLAVGSRRDPESLGGYSTSIWDKLNKIFNIVNVGSESKGIPEEDLFVPAYNGGLFNNEKYPFLSEQNGKKVGDKALAEVLEYLTMTGQAGRKEYIDYSTLNVRHLGSIYEGLLEYKLKIAHTVMFIKKTKKEEIWESRENFEGNFDSIPEDKKVKQGDLYLVTDKGERKATGSYYTPEYIVKYIVENTLGPVVDEKIRDIPEKEKVEAILSIRVLDPAMGSGHFLVEAMEYLATRIVEFIRPEELTDISEKYWAKREVLKKCIYGVDLNPLATELAKLSLWLNALPKKRPLSFLDHHLLVGNSLIGSRIIDTKKHPEEKSKEAPQLSITEDFTSTRVSFEESIKILLEIYGYVVDKPEETIQDVKEKEEKYKMFLGWPYRTMFVQLANIYTSYYFGNKISKEEYQEALDAFLEGSSAWNEKITKREYFHTAQKIAEQNKFLHWELEFPETFFEPGKIKDDPGFDVVIGNPPYYLLQGKTDEQLVFQNIYPDIFSGSDDISYYFLKKGIDLMNKNGNFGYIVTRYWMDSFYSSNLRKYILNNSSINKIIDFQNFQVFGRDVNVLAVIIILDKMLNKNSFINLSWLHNSLHTKEETVRYELDNTHSKKFSDYKIDSLKLDENPWNVSRLRFNEIFEKIEKFSFNFGKSIKMTQGIKSGRDKIFVVPEDFALERKLEKELLLNVVQGSDLDRYSISDSNEVLIYTPKDIEISKYPNIYNYLKEHEETLKKRAESDKLPFWALQRGREKEIVFSKNKILSNRIATENKFFPLINSEKVHIGLGDINMITPKNSSYSLYYYSTLLNSRLGNFYHKNNTKLKRGGYYDYSEYNVTQFPIHEVSFTTPSEEKSSNISKLRAMYDNFEFSEILSTIESCLSKETSSKSNSPEEKSDVVHDFLTFLAEKMIVMNKEKRSSVDKFLMWLETCIEIKIDDMNIKTKVREFHSENLNWEDYFKVLKRSRSKIEIKIEGMEAHDTIKEAFDSSRAKLIPLMNQIEETDYLIDQIVYRLYYLTDEEIGIVEEAS